jgi:hypothetical protein
MNFIDRAGRTYLVKNPNSLGSGVDIGYYRELVSGDFRAILVRPYDEKSFETAEQCQQWLRSKA